MELIFADHMALILRVKEDWSDQKEMASKGKEDFRSDLEQGNIFNQWKKRHRTKNM